MLFVMMKGIRRPRIKWIDLGLTKSLSVVLGSSFLFAIAQYVFSIITVYILGSQGRFAASAQLGILLSLIMLPASLLQIPIASVFQPYFARLYSPIDPSKAADFLSDFLLFVFRLTIIATLVCASFSQAIIHFFYGDQYISSAPYLIVLSPIMVLFSIEFLLIVVLLALNKPALVFPGLISQLLIVVLLTYITTSMWNANLLILSFTQSFSLVIGTVLLLWAVNKVIRFQLRPVEYLITTGLSIAVVSIARLIVAWTNGNLFWEIVGASLAFVMYLALMSKKIFGISVGEFLSLRRCKRFSSPGST
jgi:O-antigen/teichoic acid export membrane protein